MCVCVFGCQHVSGSACMRAYIHVCVCVCLFVNMCAAALEVCACVIRMCLCCSGAQSSCRGDCGMMGTGEKPVEEEGLTGRQQDISSH